MGEITNQNGKESAEVFPELEPFITEKELCARLVLSPLNEILDFSSHATN